MNKTLKIALLAIAYLAIFILGGTSGLIHPMCYAYVGALLPLLFALVYLTTTCTIQNFGAATVLNGFLLILFGAAGEADISLVVGLILLTAAAEIIRFFCGYSEIKGIRFSFIPFALSFFAYTAHWWTDTEGSLAAAVEEMPAGYDTMMKPVRLKNYIDENYCFRIWCFRFTHDTLLMQSRQRCNSGGTEHR